MASQHVELSTELERFVHSQVESGRYASATKVVHAGLRALERNAAANEAR